MSEFEVQGFRAEGFGTQDLGFGGVGPELRIFRSSL